MHFSKRIPGEDDSNEFWTLADEARRTSASLIDLTISNPTNAHIKYPEDEIREALRNGSRCQYDPDPHGSFRAREAIVEYYRRRGVNSLDPDDIYLTAGTSDAYSYLFRLLCDPGEGVLVPTPGYPLIPVLAELDGIRAIPYRLADRGWRHDVDRIDDEWENDMRAVAVVSPNNPTGAALRTEGLSALCSLVRRRDAALLVDEVFLDYPSGEDECALPSSAGESDSMVFTLGGLSKACGLPQLKLSWIVVQAGTPHAAEAKRRLDFLADAYLSVGGPVQEALPELMVLGEQVRNAIQSRIAKNDCALRAALQGIPGAIVLPREAGWYGVVELPEHLTDEKAARKLLLEHSTLVHPGYWYDFKGMEAVVVSLLPPTDIFQEGASRIAMVLHGG